MTLSVCTTVSATSGGAASAAAAASPISPMSKRVREEQEDHTQRKAARTTTTSPGGTTVITVTSRASGHVISAVLSPTSADKLGKVAQSSYRWAKQDGEVSYVGVSSDVRKRLFTEFNDRGMSQFFRNTLETSRRVRIHIEDTGKDRGRVLVQEVFWILKYEPEGNRVIIPRGADRTTLRNYLARPEQAAVLSSLQGKARALLERITKREKCVLTLTAVEDFARFIGA